MVRITTWMHLTPSLATPNNQNISGECIMKKVLVLITVSMLIFSPMGYAAGGKNHGSKGQGSTGTTGAGSITQTRGQ